MSGFWGDIRYGMRRLRNGSGTTAAAILLLALGIGANTAIFSLVNAVLRRPLGGVAEPERLVRFVSIRNGQQQFNFGYPDYVDYRDRTRLLSGVAAESFASVTFPANPPLLIRASVVSGNFFSVLGVKPAMGRLFTAEDDRIVGGHPVVVIGHGLWQRAFGGDPGAIGKTLVLNGFNFTLVGVAAPEFGGVAIGDTTEVWLPMAMQPQAIPRMTPGILQDRSAGWIGVYGRLKPQVRIEQARAEAAAIARSLAEVYPQTNEGRGADLVDGVGMSPEQRSNLKKFLGLLSVAVGLLLAITCGNVANLLLARAAARRREIAVRLALGAGRARLIRQLMTESLLLCIFAAAAGLLIAPWAVQLLRSLLPAGDSAFRVPVAVDASVMIFALVVTAVTGLCFGLAPALSATRTSVVDAIKDGTAGAGGGASRFRLQNALVVAQVALSLVLLIAAGLVLRTMRNILGIDLGFRAERVLIASMNLSLAGYTEERARLLTPQLLERLAAVPGVDSVSLAKTYPARGWGDRRSIFSPGQEPPQDLLRRRTDLGIRVETNTLAPGYFSTLGIPLVAGRDFGAQDGVGSTRVAIVSEKLAARLWPGENPMGKRIGVPNYIGPALPPVEVIGVAKDSRYRSLLIDPPLLLYMPLSQNHEVFLSIVARATGDPAALVPAVREAVAGIDRNLPLYDVQPLSTQVDTSLWQQRTAAGLIGIFGALSLLIAGAGLYSVMAYAVSQRTREYGIRMALGAKQGDVLGMVMRNAMKLALSGVVLGAVAALALNRFVAGFLYGITPTDVITYGAVMLLLMIVAAAASYQPARTATRTDPLVALRHE